MSKLHLSSRVRFPLALIMIFSLVFTSLFFQGANVRTAWASNESRPRQVLNTYTVSSPDGAVSAVVTHDTVTGTLVYRVTRGGAAVVDTSTLGLNTSIGDFNNGLTFVARSDSAINESYSLPGRKKATYANQANQMILRFSKGGQELQLLVRAYNDGFAYRYSIPGSGSLNVNSENSFFNLPDSASGWAQSFNNANYEGTYPARANFNSGGFSMPLLGHAGSNWLLISESDIGGGYQSSHLDGGGGNNIKVAWANATVIGGTRPFNTPWRLAIVGASLSTIVESNLVENLSTPSQVADTSWIVPGRSSWSWRAGGNQTDYNTHTQYVDLAASMGWEYYLVDAGWSASWVPTLVTYAQARNVKILLWDSVGNNNTEAKIRANFSLWAGWGVKGVKIDYFDNDSQATMFIYDTIARVAAEYHLLVNYHGATKPNGWMRKWPNVLTQEGVAGAEQGSLTATHNLSLVFTRNAIGPMDYTPVVYAFNGSNTTWAHQTAMAVMYSSYIQHYSDSPSQYQYSIAREFLRAVPASWDDTRLLEGSMDQYATIARRRGSDWYVGSMTATGVSRTASIPLSFLSAGTNYTAQIYRDGNSNTQIYYQSQAVTSTSTLSIPVRAGGGFAIRISTQPIAPPSGGLPGYVFCANEDGTCSFSGMASVAYGANGVFAYRTATNSIACNNATFGDPIPGPVKACYYAVPGVIFFQDSNYAGNFSGPKAQGDYASLPPDVPNDWMSSLRVPAGWAVDTYSDGGFAGTACTFTADTSFVGTACNDIMSSFRIRPATGPTATPTRTPTPVGPTFTPTRTPTRTNTPVGPTPTRTRTPTPVAPVGVIFYQDINYGGVASAVLAKGDYPANPASVPNDWMSSLRVPAGWIVDAYANGGFGGAVCTYTADTSWVGTACNDVMSSFRIR